jgi:hypothetical protein
MQEQKGIPAYESIIRLKELILMVSEGGDSVQTTPQSVEICHTQQNRQEDPNDLLYFEEPTIDNWDRLYAEEDHSGGE